MRIGVFLEKSRVAMEKIFPNRPKNAIARYLNMIILLSKSQTYDPTHNPISKGIDIKTKHP